MDLIGLLIVVQGGHSHGIQGNHGKVRGNNCDEKVREKSGKIIKNCQSKGRVGGNETVLQMSSEKKLISRVLFLCFFLSTDEIWTFYFSKFCRQIWVREKHFKSWKSQGKWKLKVNGHHAVAYSLPILRAHLKQISKSYSNNPMKSNVQNIKSVSRFFTFAKNCRKTYSYHNYMNMRVYET